MSYDYFRFKQFEVWQDKTAMKVSTDACIQGAFTVVEPQLHRIADIGAGTGLLSLMLAQRAADVEIDAFEIDEDAAAQAQTNVSASAWGNRINVLCADVTDYAFIHKYDMVICNPPFFRNSLQSPREKRNKARHGVSLSYEALAHIFKNILSPSGYASVLLPADMLQNWERICVNEGLSVWGKYYIRPTETAAFNRVVALCDRGERLPQHRELTVYDPNRNYTAQFVEMMRPFYLNL